ncbi:hypothetical protein CEXT_514841 [Caerostris extrusa]|uniref:Uncharacterized protein n=1 Tax=Caerostris extrusa TaxID=172846 RepID=A0AAV4SLY2_CAEEX|nr:hypothetical protein CEXT_514841 [Caerostris extrusa]
MISKQGNPDNYGRNILLLEECQHPSVVYFFFFFFFSHAVFPNHPSSILGRVAIEPTWFVNDMLYSMQPRARVPPVAWSMSSLAVDEHLISTLPSIYDTS